MRFLHAVTGFVLFFELPIPIYWLIIHPFNSFWRNRVRAAFWVAGLTAWTSGGALLWIFHPLLLAAARPSWVAISGGLALIGLEVYLFLRVERELAARFGPAYVAYRRRVPAFLPFRVWNKSK